MEQGKWRFRQEHDNEGTRGGSIGVWQPKSVPAVTGVCLFTEGDERPGV